MATGSGKDPASVPVPLDRDRFLRALIHKLAGTLEDVVGVEEAKGYFSVVGGAIGTAIDSDYRAALQLQRLDRAHVAAVLVDLKRIQGDFYVISEDDERRSSWATAPACSATRSSAGRRCA